MKARRTQATSHRPSSAAGTNGVSSGRRRAPVSRRTPASGAPRGRKERGSFHDLVDLLPLPVFECDEHWRITYANPRAFEMFGFSKADFERGVSMLDTLIPAHRRRAAGNARGLRPGRPSSGNEYTALRRNGTTFPIAAYTSTIVDDGRVVGLRGIAVDISERKHAEDALRESEERFRSIIEKSTNLFYVHSPDNVFTYVSPQIQELLGYRPEEAIGRPWTDIVSDGPMNDVVFERTRRSIETGVRQPPYEVELVARDGRRVLLEVHEAPLVVDGRTVAVIGAAQDVTERRKAEGALREREATLDSIFRAAPIGIALLFDGVFLQVNDRICDMTGYARGELVGATPRALYMTDQEFDYVAHVEHGQIAREGRASVETRWRRKDGSVIDVLLSSAPLTPGNLASAVTLTAVDITERRHAEEALRGSERKYRQLVETLQEGVWMVDADGLTTFVNPRMADMLGYTVGEMTGKSIFAYLDAAGVEEAKRRQELGAGGARGLIDFKLVHKDGHPVYVRVEASPILDENGVYTGALAGVQDNTERVKADEERRRLDLQLQKAQKLESLGVLAGGIAHDFNNILTAIHGNLELAVSDLPPGAPALESLAEVDKASRRAADLCRQLLAYSGKGRFALGATDLGRAIDQLTTILRVSVSKKVALRFDIAPDLPPIEADETQVQQVVMNLIVNASEALEDGIGVINVAAGAVECDRAYLKRMLLGERLTEGQYVFLEVADTGVGMDEETQAKIFDPFFSTKFAGRGLGLPVVLGIVRGHRGAIGIHSTKGKGTTVQVLFPVSNAALERVEDLQPGSGDWHGSGTVLFVDDEDIVRAVSKRMLEHLGFEVFLAADGREGIDLFRARRDEIACVILDLTMPKLDGVETLAEMRRISAKVPVVLSSGFSEHEISKRYARKGFAGFIEKPYRLVTLGEKLRSVLEPRASRVGES